jgi:hypothetical protein
MQGDAEDFLASLYRVQFENHGSGASPIADPRTRLLPRTCDYGFQTGHGLAMPITRQLTKRMEKGAEQPMGQAPRDGPLVKLVPAKGASFIGYFAAKRHDWVNWGDFVSLIRPDHDFSGWRPRKAKKGSSRQAL